MGMVVDKEKKVLKRLQPERTKNNKRALHLAPYFGSNLHVSRYECFVVENSQETKKL